MTSLAHTEGRSAGRPRLVVVSNRLPLSFKRESGKLEAVASSGGLIGALEPIVKEHGGIGWGVRARRTRRNCIDC